MKRNYDPNAPSTDNGNFAGLPFDDQSANIILIPVPYDVTTSSAAGTADGPENIRRSSLQLDLFDLKSPNGWKKGIFMLPQNEKILKNNHLIRPLSEAHIKLLESGLQPTQQEQISRLDQINQACQQTLHTTADIAHKYIDQGKTVGLIGGDHSTAWANIVAHSKVNEAFGILQIDAHCDLRDAYEGFIFSHASVMRHAAEMNQVNRIVQVGIRDFCEEEFEFITASNGKIVPFYDAILHEKKFNGIPFHKICEEIISFLPGRVYVSIDVDGLSPEYCPNTGTPVPGGLTYAETVYLIEQINSSGRKIIGFDICETAGDGYVDGIVAAKLILKLCYLI